MRARRKADADVRAVPELARVGLALDVLLQGDPAGRIGVDDGPARARVREVRLVEPVVEQLAELEHPEEQEDEDRQDERELSESLALFPPQNRSELPRTAHGQIAEAMSVSLAASH